MPTSVYHVSQASKVELIINCELVMIINIYLFVLPPQTCDTRLVVYAGQVDDQESFASSKAGSQDNGPDSVWTA